MKSKKPFIYIGVVLIAIVSFFATKAEKKIASVTSARLPFISGSAITGLPAAHFTTIKGLFGKTVFLVTVGAKNTNPALSTLKTSISTFASNVYWH